MLYGMARTISAAFIIFILAGCAQPGSQQIKKLETKTDFASGIDVSASYHGRDDGAIVVCDLFNQRGRSVRSWFWHRQQTDDQQVLRGIMYYEGNETKKREVFKIPPAEPGLTETFWIEKYEKGGKKLIESKPISSTSDTKGGRP